MAVRVIIGGRDLKGRLQESHVFPKNGDWPEKEMPPSPSQETPVHTKIFVLKHTPPTGNKKTYKA
jgi:hypothetical protein